MADAVAAPAVAPTNGAHPTTPQKPVVVKPTAPVKAAEPVDDSEEYVVDGKQVRLSKAQRALHVQKGLGADKRFKEAAEMRKEAEELKRLAESDPEEFIRRLGKDPDKVFAASLEKKARLELMTQEQREAAALKERAEAAEKKAAELEKSQQDERQKALDQQTWLKVEKGLLDAADKYKLAGEPEILDALCDINLEYLEHGISITPEQACEEWIRRDKEYVEAKDKKLHSVLKGEKLLKYLGDATLAEIQAAIKARDAASLGDIPKPVAKVKVAAHERAVRPKTGHIGENDFDKKFGI